MAFARILNDEINDNPPSLVIKAPKALIGLGLALFALLAALPLVTAPDSYLLHILISVFIFATLGHAWNLLAGYGGMLSFGQQVFIGLGGFSMAILGYYASVPWPVAWIGAGLTALAFASLLGLPSPRRGRISRYVGAIAAIALLYELAATAWPGMDLFADMFTRRASLLLIVFLGGLPLLKLKGAHFAIATWLIAEAVSTIFNGWPLAGAGGGMQISTEIGSGALYYLALCLAAVVTSGVALWVGSTYGLALTAVRDDEDAAESCGVDVTSLKRVIFLVGALVTGLASGLYYTDTMLITPVSGFSISWSSYIVFVVVAGGMGTVSGPIVGAVIFVMTERILGQWSGQGQLVLGLISIVLMLFMPQGIVGLASAFAGRFGPMLAAATRYPSKPIKE